MKIYKDAQIISKIYKKFGKNYHDSRKNGQGRLFNEYLDIPATLSLMTKVTGLRVLDAGCGSGIYSCLLAKRGARVTGIDISKTMIQIAKKETSARLHVTYKVGNIYELPFENSKFDVILCNYVLENVKNIKEVFREFYRVLVPGGTCIFSISHPLRAQSEKEVIEGKERWIITNYFKEGMRMSNFGGGMMVPKYTRTLQTYLKALTSSGFLIQALLEPRPLKKGQQIDPINYEKSMRLPQLLTVQIIKVGL